MVMIGAVQASAPPTTEDLVRRARSGDHAAFDALVDARIGSTFRLARAIVGDAADAEDVVQDAFLQAWRNLPGLREPERFEAWFRRIVVSSARMSNRRRRPIVALRVVGETADGRAAASEPGAADRGIEDLGGSDALQRAIDRLTADQRTILALHHLEERPIAEIATILGIPSGTVKWRLHAARNALERAMESER